VTAQLAGVFSLVSSSVAVLGESVSKSIGASTEQQSSSGGVLAPETIDAYKQSVSAGWSNLATGAVGLWSKSLEVVQAITKPPDDDDVSPSTAAAVLKLTVLFYYDCYSCDNDVMLCNFMCHCLCVSLV
jgi:hypothetical protein